MSKAIERDILKVATSSEYLGTTVGILAGWYAESAVERYVPHLFGAAHVGEHHTERLLLRVGIAALGLVAAGSTRSRWVRDAALGVAAIETVHIAQAEGLGRGF